MIRFLPLFLAALTVSGPTGAGASDNAYDLFHRAVHPVALVLANDAKGDTLLASGTASMAGQPPVGWRLALRPPSQMRLEIFPTKDQSFSLVRDGQDLWLVPADALEKLPSPEAATRALQPGGTALPALQLPVNSQALALLPALLQIRDAGSVEIEGQAGRRLNIQPIGELSKETGPVELELWVREDRPRMIIVNPNTAEAVQIAIGDLRIAETAPASLWTPGEDSRPIGFHPDRLEELLQSMR